MPGHQEVEIEAIMSSVGASQSDVRREVPPINLSAESTLDVSVTDCWRETNDIRAFELRTSDSGALPNHDPGCHIDVFIKGLGTRQYSICNPSSETDRYVIAVKNDATGRGGSRFMHEAVQRGATLKISAPRNNFPLVDGASRNLFIAGGIGVTPILPMLDKRLQSNIAFEFHHFVRERSEIGFRAMLRDTRYGGKINLRIDAEEIGSFDQRYAFLAQQPPGTHVYVCGPSAMITYVRDKAGDLGFPSSHIHSEHFGATQNADIDVDVEFDLRLVKSGRTLKVPSNKSALDVLLDHGVAIPFSCEQGVCGTCRTLVVEGRPLHRDQCLTQQERDAGNVFTPCCSRAATKTLMIDL
jgi:vanillate monooxygenase ferredoxin subunit